MLLATKVLIIVVISRADASDACNSPICFEEAAKIKEYIDRRTNPCDDFYQFACGNFLKNAQGDESLGYLHKFRLKRKRELLEMYQEPVKGDEHKMVKVAKRLFQACMNETEIERDNLQTIKEALGAVWGWPVVEGSTWNGSDFNWVKASYKLRELGYHFSSFLDLDVQLDPENHNKYILSVNLPNVWDKDVRGVNRVILMTDVALIFGAEDVIKTGNEMRKVQDFLMDMQKLALKMRRKFTIQKYQEQYQYFNWLNFINNMMRGAIRVSKDDVAEFPPIDVIRQWLRLISRTPKRIQANYMAWKIVQDALPYLTMRLRKLAHKYDKEEPREQFCLREAEDRFVPSPIGIMYDRKCISPEKKKQVEEQMLSIKSVLVDILEQTDWIEDGDRINIIEKANATSLIFGHPGNWSDDVALDEIDVDMVENGNESFLTLIAEANRNRMTTLYSTYKKSLKQTLAQRWYLKYDNTGLPLYSAEDNLIYIPAVTLAGSLFQEDTPRYLNYGVLGYEFGGVLTEFIKTFDLYENNGWSKHTKETFISKIACMRKELEVFQLSQGLIEITLIITHSFGQQVSYKAYEKWVETHGEELQLSGLSYTPKQLFWISSATTFCQPVNLHHRALPELVKDPTMIANVVSASKRNVPDFAEDFSCPLGSKMNPPKRCNFVRYEESDNTTIAM